MVKRLSDMPEAEANHLRRLECPTYDDTPALAGKPWPGGGWRSFPPPACTSAATGRSGPGDGSYRVIPGRERPPTSWSWAISRSTSTAPDFQQDLNVVFPIDRLRDLVADGTVGAMASVTISFMGAFPPAAAEPHAQHLAGLLKADKVDAALLVPV